MFYTGTAMNIPNTLTLFRLLLIPVFILIFFSNVSNSLLLSIGIFLIAGISDVLDGYIARKYNLITKWGMVLDPLADKLMLITVLACLVVYGYAPLWILIIVVVKEALMIISASFLYRQNTVIPSNIFGKISTLLFYLSIFIISFEIPLGNYLLYIAVLGAVVALINYIVVFLRGRRISANQVK